MPVNELLLAVCTEGSCRRVKNWRLNASTAQANMLKAQEDEMVAGMAALQQKVDTLILQLQGEMASGSHCPTGLWAAGKPIEAHHPTGTHGFCQGHT